VGESGKRVCKPDRKCFCKSLSCLNGNEIVFAKCKFLCPEIIWFPGGAVTYQHYKYWYIIPMIFCMAFMLMLSYILVF